MDLTVAIYIDSIEEAPNLLLISEISHEKLLDVFKCDVTIVFMIYLIEDFPKPFCLLFVDFAAVCYYVLNALTEKK